ncbi:peptidoglycan glycosyltransferase [Streptoalloteichus tenebrarius]|uniref:Peptidoglycan glycosyltransferase n=1 Tax=Streptoalloteichus tenebrarius (strain ATCC 17920 / DSM 40477 / JCM 4838 / CBS 697.72 / NBRC 16177 / NCIMB 11028 / NRRL B-12390 / A12253. 1 / ISP 5477) TaxID=1933 RepID=A0ABT1I2A8_STRSD|nr:transglycosylase domain-containing protein [Streptoalloteichus tenebrarius]MCP2261921.1 peptidoglycan glycosyltransferase [Streptoalloteichus tenebrarius]BFF02088.1 transglycosylase domain-containing protein [Streptoalloteichus tenebrarius]
MGGVSAFVLVGALVVGYRLAYVMWDVPEPAEIAASQNQTVTLYYADGRTELARIHPDGGARTLVRFEDIPKSVQDAVLSAENATFWTDDGFSVRGMIGAIYNNLRGRDGGGSTITQQYVKKATGKEEHSLTRKVRELVLAKKLTDTHSKQEILTAYLNTIYFGRGANGVQAAARAYFGKDVRDLDVSEAAVLAGVIQRPTYWDPAVDRENSEARWNYVMDRMVENGFLDRKERERAKFPAVVPRASEPGARAHIKAQVLAELEERAGIGLDEAQQHGYRVVTTLDRDAQSRAETAVREVMTGQPDSLRAALVSIDPRTGGVAAYFGGDNGNGLDYAQSLQEPGTAFTPFTAVAFHQRGLSPARAVGPGVSEGDIAALTKWIGPGHVADAAYAAGIPREVRGRATITSPDEQLGVGGGRTAVRPFDLAAAYATLTDGQRSQPHFVDRVLTAAGEVRHQFSGTRTPAFHADAQASADTAREITSLLETNQAQVNLPAPANNPVAVQPGVLRYGSRGQVAKAWTAGYTPQLATAVWVGSDRFQPIKGRYQERAGGEHDIDGKREPAAIWSAVMGAYHENRAPQPFPTPNPQARPIPPTTTSAQGAPAGSQKQQQKAQQPPKHTETTEK